MFLTNVGIWGILRNVNLDGFGFWFVLFFVHEHVLPSPFFKFSVHVLFVFIVDRRHYHELVVVDLSGQLQEFVSIAKQVALGLVVRCQERTKAKDGLEAVEEQLVLVQQQ